MEPAQWQRVKVLFDAALQQEPGQRSGFVDEACAGDAVVRAEVLSLLASFDRANSFIEPPPLNPAAARTDASGAVSLVGRQVGPYQLLREIAQGGMGTIYLAARADQQYQKRVAVKVIRATLDRQEVVRRFRQERQMLAALTHPNIVTLLDGGTTEQGLPFLVMDYVEGLSIDAYCDAQRLSTTERVRLFLGVCAAVQYAHQNLVVHRDLKPSNILVTPEGIPKLLDFGIAKLLRPEFSPQMAAVTRTSERPMTLEYASPEQIRGEPITTATDVYALGVVLYQVLTGHLPYRVRIETPFELERAICEVEPEKPSTAVTRRPEPDDPTGPPMTPERVSRTREGAPNRLQRRLAGDLDTIVLMALRKEPQRRYASVEQLGEDLRRHLENRPVLARRPTWQYRAGKFMRRHTAAVVAASLVVVTLAGGIAATMRQTFIARAERARAERRFNDVRKLAQSMFTIHDAIQNLDGATPARRLIVSTAVEYLDRLNQEAAGDTSLQTELADGYLKVGDVQGYPYLANLGDLDGALGSYRKALKIAEAVFRTDSQSVSGRWLLARSHERVGAALAQHGDAVGAEKEFRQALAIYEQLSVADRRNVPVRQDLARCYDSLGDALGNPAFLSQRDTTAALDSYRRALAVDEEIAARDRSNRRARRGIGVESMKIADMLAERFDTARALESYRNALAIFKELADSDPTNAELRRAQEVVYGRIAKNLPEIDDVAGALGSAQQELAIAEVLLEKDPNNALAQHDVAIALKHLGDLHAQQGKEREALSNYRRLLAIIEPLTADSSNAQWRSQLAEIVIGIGRLQAKAGQFQEARLATTRGLSILKAQVEQPDAGPDELNMYASALLACEPEELRDPRAALHHAERAAALTQRKNAAILDTLALAYFQSGDRELAVATEKEVLELLPQSVPAALPSATRREYETNLAKYTAPMKAVRTSRPTSRPIR